MDSFAAWLFEKAWSFLWRTAVTVAAAWTIYQISGAAIRVDFATMLIAAGVTVLVKHIWVKWP